jgi:hypothetical protein
MLGGMDREEMRAGDGDRQAVADKLKAALDEGRLDLGEYDERLQRTYSARTYGDLQGLVNDLPGTIPVSRSQVQPVGSESPVMEPAAGKGGMPTWLGPYAGVVAVSVVIWAIVCISSGELLYFWPIWMFIPLIFGVIGQMTGRGRRDL